MKYKTRDGLPVGGLEKWKPAPNPRLARPKWYDDTIYSAPLRFFLVLIIFTYAMSPKLKCRLQGRLFFI